MKRLAILPVALALALAACGSDEDDSTAPTTEAPADTEASEEPAGSTTPAATDGESTPVSVPAECAPDSDVWLSPGTLTVATGEPAFPPYVIDDDPTNGEGFESAVVYAVAGALGFADADVTWVRTTFDEAIAPGAKDYDFNLQQYSITADRDEIVDFSLPYYTAQKSLIVPADSPAASATSFADIQDLKYGATIGTTDADYITDTIGIADADVAIYDDQAATFAAMSAGQIDATVIGLPTALYQTAVELEGYVVAGVLPRLGDESDGMGMLFADGNPARDCVDIALQALTDDGTLAALDEQWMQGGGDIPEITE